MGCISRCLTEYGEFLHKPGEKIYDFHEIRAEATTNVVSLSEVSCSPCNVDRAVHRRDLPKQECVSRTHSAQDRVAGSSHHDTGHMRTSACVPL